MVNFTDGDILLIIVGFFLPPLAVALKRGCTADFLISIGLTLLGHIPGVAYAWYIVYQHRNDPNLNRYQGRTYIAVPQSQSQNRIQQQPVVAHHQPPPYQATTAGAPAPVVAPAPVK